MGLTSLPTKTSGSLGIDKVDNNILPYATDHLHAGEWNNSTDALVGICQEVGNSNISTSGSLVAKSKAYIDLDYYGTASMALSNTLPNPAYNSGWTNPRISQVNSSNSLNNYLTLITADPGGITTVNAAVWWFDQTVPFGKYNISFNVGTNPEIPSLLPGTGSDLVMLGLIYAAVTNSSAGLAYLTGVDAGVWKTWKLVLGAFPNTPYSIIDGSGAYFSRINIEVVSYKQPNTLPGFIISDTQVGIFGKTFGINTSGQFILTSSAWATSDLDRVGIILIGSCSLPITMSLSDVKVYPRFGDPGYAI